MKTWILPVDGEMCRVVLEKDTLDIWVNGKKVEVAAEFTDDGMIDFLQLEHLQVRFSQKGSKSLPKFTSENLKNKQLDDRSLDGSHF